MLLPFEAHAIVRYLVQDMTCQEVQQAIERDGAAILYRKASASGLPLYNRYVRTGDFCEAGQKIARSSVATADTSQVHRQQVRGPEPAVSHALDRAGASGPPRPWKARRRSAYT